MSFTMTTLSKKGEAKESDLRISIIQLTKKGLKTEVQLILPSGDKIDLKIKDNTRVIFM